MARGISLHVGINEVSVAAFRARPLFGPENDAQAMRAIALSCGFHPDDARLLLGPEATFKKVTDEIHRAAGLLGPGDTFLFTFAGHGSRIPDDERMLSEEPDREDEALVLFDRLLLDDFLRRVLWPEFAEGVRIVGVNDSCHSATSLSAMVAVSVSHEERLTVDASGDAAVFSSVTQVSAFERAVRPAPRDWPRASNRFQRAENNPDAELEFAERALDPEARREHREVKFGDFYDGLNISSLADAPTIRARLLVLGACEDKARTRDGDPHGEFTQALLDVWDGGNFSGDYVAFKEQIRARLPARVPKQVPNLTAEPSPGFSGSAPFRL